MPNTAEITATIIDMLAAREWAITPCTGEPDCWLVSPDSSGTEILLVLQPSAVASYVGGLIAGYLPHEVVDAVGSAPIAEELAWTAAQSLYGALSGAAPGLLTEIGIRNGQEGDGAEVYSIRAMRAYSPIDSGTSMRAVPPGASPRRNLSRGEPPDSNRQPSWPIPWT